MIVIGGSSSVRLAREIAENLGCEFIQASTSRFPDGECYTKIEKEKLEGEVVIVQNTYPDGNLVEMLLIRDAAANLGAGKITMVIPYFGYARQDRLFKPGEPMSARVMCGILDAICDKVITIGGIYGEVVTVKEQTFIVKIADNTKVELMKSAVSSVPAGEEEKK